jgi:hypothetical protein
MLKNIRLHIEQDEDKQNALEEKLTKKCSPNTQNQYQSLLETHTLLTDLYIRLS